MKNKENLNTHQMSRRSFVKRALTAAGWVAVSGSYVLRPDWAHAAGPIKMGIAVDVTGPWAGGSTNAWLTAQLTVKKINDAGGILGKPIELILEDTASDTALAVGNVRRLIQKNVDVVIGGTTSSMRNAIKNPIVNRGKTLMFYPSMYEGQECTPHLYCTGPTPNQQCAELIPYLIKQGNKRFALPGANYIWPQVLNKWVRRVIEENGGEVVLEEYFPLDQVEYSATISKIVNEKVDHVFLTIIPPGLTPFGKQLWDSGFQKNGGTISCVYYNEWAPLFVEPYALEGTYSCLDYFQTVDDAFSKQLLADYNAMWPDTKFPFTSAMATGTYRGIKIYEKAVIATNGDLAREAVSEAMDSVSVAQGPGGPFKVVPGTNHTAMNMYVAQNKGGAWDILLKSEMVPPNECG